MGILSDFPTEMKIIQNTVHQIIESTLFHTTMELVDLIIPRRFHYGFLLANLLYTTGHLQGPGGIAPSWVMGLYIRFE